MMIFTSQDMSGLGCERMNAEGRGSQFLVPNFDGVELIGLV